MKPIVVLAFITMATTVALCQENMVTLSGGYAFANLDETDTDASGWRINALYEFNPMQEKWAHGISFGYIGTTADVQVAQSQTVEQKLSTWPLYYAPKFMFGKETAKGFIKGALGWQWTGIDRSGPALEGDTNDSGFYGGASAGFMKSFNKKVFINLEYEWAYMANAYYRNGMMNSILLGVGFRF